MAFGRSKHTWNDTSKAVAKAILAFTEKARDIATEEPDVEKVQVRMRDELLSTVAQIMVLTGAARRG